MNMKQTSRLKRQSILSKQFLKDEGKHLKYLFKNSFPHSQIDSGKTYTQPSL